MRSTRNLFIFAFWLGLASVCQCQPQRTKTHPQVGFRIPTFELAGKLAGVFSIKDCEYISGLTCKIRYSGVAPLPSKVFFTEIDEHGKKLGPPIRLIYPKLKKGETGYATFRIRVAEPAKLLLKGEWNGPWRDPY